MSDENTNYLVPTESDFSMVPEKVTGIPEMEIIPSDNDTPAYPSTHLSEGCLIAGGIIKSSTDVAIETIDKTADVAKEAIRQGAEIRKEKIRVKGIENIERYRSDNQREIEVTKSNNEAKMKISGDNATVAINYINNGTVQNADEIVKILNAAPQTEKVEEQPKKKKGFFARLFGGDD